MPETCWPCTGCACAKWRLAGHAQGVHGQTGGLLALHGVCIMQSEALLALHRACMCKLETFWHCTGCACANWRLAGHAQGVRVQIGDFLALHRELECILGSFGPCTRVCMCKAEACSPCTGRENARQRLVGHAQGVCMQTGGFLAMHRKPLCTGAPCTPSPRVGTKLRPLPPAAVTLPCSAFTQQNTWG